MKKVLPPIGTLTLAVAGLVLPGAASAQSTWNLVANGNTGGACAQGATNSGNFGNSWSCTGAGGTITASAFSTQAGTSGAGTLQNINAGTQYANAYMSAQGTSGFGAANRTEGLGATSPDHAVDNNPTGSYDMIVLNFGSAVILNQIGVGWTANASGADISILRWTGAGAPTATTATVTTGGNGALLRSGWTLVSSLADVIGDNVSPYGGNARDTYAGTGASSWWMIAAFNTTLNTSNSCYTNNTGGTVAENTAIKDAYGTVTGYRCDDADDAFKLNWVKATPSGGGGGGGGSAPEPGTLALAGIALAGVGLARRRAQKQA